MKNIYRDVILTILLGIVVPAFLFYVPDNKGEQTDILPETTLEFVSQEPATHPMITLLRTDGTVEEIELEEYVLCVVLKEMPASFEPDALKAQAVVARTYAVKRLDGNTKHPEASLCTNAQCCQGYCTVEDYLAQGGKKDAVEKVQLAVTDTANEVITYENALIDATYFSCSGGITEDAEVVWGTDVPYLQSVESPGEENASHFADTTWIPLDDFQSLLGQQMKNNPQKWLQDISYTDGGSVATIRFENITYNGTTFRQKLGLRSTAFHISVTDNGVLIQTRGFGHRVGMSQYGADAMAVNGHTYKEILTHYYTGVEITTYSYND